MRPQTTRRWPRSRLSTKSLLYGVALILLVCGQTSVQAGRKGATAIPLAGHPRPESPFFRHVDAFNGNETVQAMVDPTRFPGILSKTCDVYVVEPRSAAQWAANPQLSGYELRPGGPQVVTFPDPSQCDGTCGVTDTTFTVDLAGTSTDPDECKGSLDPDCVGFGHGYDLVLDCGGSRSDPDGVLGKEDFIDGLADRAGFYRMYDGTVEGPRLWASTSYTFEAAHAEAFGLDDRRSEITYFPTAPKGKLPLVVVTPGRGHQYNWYGYLQSHLASYGYVVMSHQRPLALLGVEQDYSVLLFRHIDALLAALESATCSELVEPDTVCDLLIDTERIVLIGHSRGGEGAVRMHNKLENGIFSSTRFSHEDVRLIVAMAPSDAYGLETQGISGEGTPARPNGVPFHLLYGSADADVSGEPQTPGGWGFTIFERANGPRHATYIHGAGHGFFHDFCCPSISQDPTPACALPSCADQAGDGFMLNEEDTHGIVRGMTVALIKHYLEGSVPASEYLWRPWEFFRPQGATAAPRVALEYRNPDQISFVLDDFQEQPSDLFRTSSGTAVAATVTHLHEGRLIEGNCTFELEPGILVQPCYDASGIDPMNGMTRARPTDEAQGVVFDWPDDGAVYKYEIDLPRSKRDLSDQGFLSFRAAQMTRHPLNGGLIDFSVVLVDGKGNKQAIRVDSYTTGLFRTYRRKSARPLVVGDDSPPDTGYGWQNAFEVFRIRLTDFLAAGSPLNLQDVRSVVFEFGGQAGTGSGRIALDDIEITRE